MLAFSFFYSCKTETSNQDLEATAVTSETGSGTQSDKAFAVKDASYVIHYKQKVLKNSDDELYVTSTSDGFEQAEAEDKSANPVKALTQLKTLAKNYEGFSYSYAIQKASTIYIYYTRNTVEYSFYKDANTLSAKIRGVYGLTCTPPDVLIGNNVVTKWNSSPDGSGSTIPSEFGPANASYYSNGTGIGTKYKPTTAGDIVFTDGTASTTEQVKTASDTLKENYKKYALAVIVFDHYNTYSGSPDDGKKLIGVGIRALDIAENYFQCLWKDGESIPRQILNCKSYSGYYDLQKLLDLFPDNNADSRDKFWRAIWRSTKYIDICKEKITADISDRVKDNWYLPCWQELGLTLAGDFKYYGILKNAYLAIELGGITNGKNFWTTPSMYVDTTIGNTTTSAFYAAYVTASHGWAQLDYTLTNNVPKDAQWKKSAKYGEAAFWLLPFREFK